MDIEKARKEIIELIDDHYSGWVKAAFYSDPDVARIMDRLISEWEKGDQNKSPIEYATGEELLILLNKARKYFSLDETTARAIAMNRMASDEEEGPSIWGVFSRAIRRLFSSGRQGASL